MTQKAIARATEWQQQNRERHNDHVREYAKRNPDVGKAATKRWRERNIGTVLYAQRDMLSRAKKRAKTKEYDFNITIEDIQAAWPADGRCPALGIELDLTGQNREHSPSLDRIDTTKGYIRGNVVVVSYRANSIKQDSDLDELKSLVTFYSGLITSTSPICNFDNTYSLPE